MGSAIANYNFSVQYKQHLRIHTYEIPWLGSEMKDIEFLFPQWTIIIDSVGR